MTFTLINFQTKLSLFNGPTKNPVVNITWTNPGVGCCTFVLIGNPSAQDGLLAHARALVPRELNFSFLLHNKLGRYPVLIGATLGQ